MSSTWSYRTCPVCSSGGSRFAFSRGSQQKIARPKVSLLVLVSTVAGDGPRKQKSSGSLAMCPSCLAAILDGKPLPKMLLDGIESASKQIGIELQRALPLKAKKKK